MPMPEIDKIALHKTLDSLEEMVQQDSIEPEWYHKALVDGAYQYLKHKDVEKMLSLLGQVPVVYYAETLKEHMDNDPEYANQVYDIAMVLTKNNIVHLGLSDYEQTNLQRA